MGTTGRAGTGVFVLVAWLFVQLGVAQSLPEPALFDAAWSDRSEFAVDLQPEVRVIALARDESPVYHLDWTLESDTRLVARQEVRVVNYSDDPWEELYFQLLPNLLGGEMVVAEVRLGGEAVRPGSLGQDWLLQVPLSAPLTPGEGAVVSIAYELTIPTRGGGNYGILASRSGVLSLAHAYALLAVYDSEGWDVDEPATHGDLVHARSSFFRVRVNAPRELVIAASGRVREQRVQGERQELEILAGPVRDFYLAAGAELEPITLEVGDVVVRGYALPGREETTELAVEIAGRSLEEFGRRYGRYPFRELDVVPISTSALGVEFPGIIALRHELLTPRQLALLESTVVHEVAHQWFYSLVGNDQVSEPWLDESLTQYLTLRYYLAEHGAHGYRIFREDLISRWEQIGRRPARIGYPVSAYDNNEYGAIVYGLGPLVIEWLAARLGRQGFDEFLAHYVATFAFDLASGEDFRRLAEEHCGCSLVDFYEEWVAPVDAP